MAAKLSSPLKSLWRISLALAAVGGWAAAVALLGVPSEAASARFFGYSLERLILAAAALLPALLFSHFALRAWRDEKWLQKNSARFSDRLQSAAVFWTVSALVSLALITTWVLAFLPAGRATQLLGPYSLYLPRLYPLLLFATLLAALLLPLLLFQRFGLDSKAFKGERSTLKLALAIFAIFLLFIAIVAIAGLGMGFDATTWNAPGAPILVTQIFLCLVAAPLLLAAAFALRTRFPKHSKKVSLEVGLAALVWILAAIFWLQQPAEPTYYNSEALPPDNQSYPLSDAFNHDVIANNVLIGEGFRFGGNVATRRPIYVQFLAGLELLLGANYANVVTAQVIVLALFPAFLFLMASRLHNPLSGLLVAGFIIFREANSIALGHVVNMSHAKLLMADLPTALAMSAFGLGAVAWLRGHPHNWLRALLVGGLLGWFILLRSQVLTLVPFFVLLALIVWGWRVGWRPAVLFVLGVLLVASPWIIRNRVLMGQWAIEDAAVAGFIATRYSFTPGTFGLPFLPGESEGDFYARHMGTVRAFTLENPGYVAGFVADNYARNLILTALPMPLSLQLRTLEGHVRQLPYWPSWDGHLIAETYLPLTANLLLVALGIAVAWRQARWAGLVPLIINLGFTANLALARVSGWRYNLPADWSTILYYALGLGQLFVWLLMALRANPAAKGFLTNLQSAPARLVAPKARPWSQYALALLGLLLVGNSFSIIEALSSPRFHELTSDQAIHELAVATTENEADKEQLFTWLQDGTLEAVPGRAMHPRYYRAGDGVAENDFVPTQVMDFARISFYLLGPEPGAVILPVSTPNLDFPASSDVIVLRCDASDYGAAAVIVQTGRNQSHLLLSSDFALSCQGSDS
jgi:hypothetical protein